MRSGRKGFVTASQAQGESSSKSVETGYAPQTCMIPNDDCTQISLLIRALLREKITAVHCDLASFSVSVSFGLFICKYFLFGTNLQKIIFALRSKTLNTCVCYV